ncbi:MAG: Tm-1-like ATP-binding domain-containing protein [Daejeonella sp.]
MAKVIVIGAFDTKTAEYKFIIDLLREFGHDITTINTGVLEFEKLFNIDISSAEVSQAGGWDIKDLRNANDRGQAIKVMSEGAALIVKELSQKEGFDGIIGMGGTAGTYMVTAGMRDLPYGLPKICLSTVASGDVSPYVGISDIIMIPSLTDIAGINSLSKVILSNAVAALSGMLSLDSEPEQKRTTVAASMFGNTTPCIDRCRENLTDSGYEVLVFHATGAGGRTMEKLVAEGLIQGVLDITTTEWADTVCDGVFNAGTERLDAPGKMGIPHLIAPGCIDMCNFGSPDSIPAKYKHRLFYQWNPNVTLMRTTVAENEKMGEIFAQKANASKGKVAFLIPLRGFSMLDSINEEGVPQIFWDPSADQAFLKGLKNKLKPQIEIVEVDANINDGLFAARAVELFQVMM